MTQTNLGAELRPLPGCAAGEQRPCGLVDDSRGLRGSGGTVGLPPLTEQTRWTALTHKSVTVAGRE